MNLTCKEASRLLSSGLDKELSPADRTSLRLHLAICAACKRLEEQFKFLRRALSAYSGRGPGRDDERGP
jgi:anti-sigma factor RsiW